MPWEVSSTASIFGGEGDGKKEMLRKKFYVVRKKNHVVRKLFYVASIFHTPRSPRHHYAAPMTTERPTLDRCAQVLKTWQRREASQGGLRVAGNGHIGRGCVLHSQNYS